MALSASLGQTWHTFFRLFSRLLFLASLMSQRECTFERADKVKKHKLQTLRLYATSETNKSQKLITLLELSSILQHFT